MIELLREQGVNVFTAEKDPSFCCFDIWCKDRNKEIVDYIKIIDSTTLKVKLLNKWGYKTRSIHLKVEKSIKDVFEYLLNNGY